MVSFYAINNHIVFLDARDLTAAYTKVSNSVFTTGNGERPNATNWIFTVLAGPASAPTTAAAAATTLRQQFNSTMFSVGVGSNVALSELVSYASSSAYAFSFRSADLITGFATQFVCTNLITTGKILCHQVCCVNLR